jgi:cobalt/nickel transport protein
MKNLRFKVVLVFSLVVVFLFGSLMVANAHFGTIIPSDDMVTPGDNKSIGLKIQFIHPMEGDYMDMAKPATKSFMLNLNLIGSLRRIVLSFIILR